MSRLPAEATQPAALFPDRQSPIHGHRTTSLNVLMTGQGQVITE